MGELVIELGVVPGPDDEYPPPPPGRWREVLRAATAAAVTVLALLTLVASRPLPAGAPAPVRLVTDRARVDGDTAYLGRAGTVVAVGLRTGRVLWEVPTPGAQPEVRRLAGGTVLVVTHVDDTDPEVLALDRTTGRTRWTAPGDLLQVHGDIAVVGPVGPAVTGIGVADGKTRWQAELGTGQLLRPADPGTDALGVFTATGTVRVIDPATGAELCRIDGLPYRRRVFGLVQGDVVLLSSTWGEGSSPGSTAAAYDLRSGRLLWQRDAPDRRMLFFPGHRRAWLSDGQGTEARDPRTGEVAWTLPGRFRGWYVTASGRTVVQVAGPPGGSTGIADSYFVHDEVTGELLGRTGPWSLAGFDGERGVVVRAADRTKSPPVSWAGIMDLVPGTQVWPIAPLTGYDGLSECFVDGHWLLCPAPAQHAVLAYPL